ncbi:MAG: hypothetical protein K2K57_00400, partial [Oscillospiraceae bacterium]|nr:hypothetical protein [Oscillospiraceae bacterium]
MGKGCRRKIAIAVSENSVCRCRISSDGMLAKITGFYFNNLLTRLYHKANEIASNKISYHREEIHIT